MTHANIALIPSIDDSVRSREIITDSLSGVVGVSAGTVAQSQLHSQWHPHLHPVTASVAGRTGCGGAHLTEEDKTQTTSIGTGEKSRIKQPSLGESIGLSDGLSRFDHRGEYLNCAAKRRLSEERQGLLRGSLRGSLPNTFDFAAFGVYSIA